MTNEEMKALFEDWKGGDKAAYNKLYKEMYAIVSDTVKANADESSQKDSENIAQDVMVKVYQSIETLTDSSRYEEWLKDIVISCLKEKEILAEPITTCDSSSTEVKHDKGTKGMMDSESETDNKGNKSEQTDTAETKSDKKKLFCVIGILAVIIVAAICLFLTSTPTIDMNKYTTVTFEGYDGYGTASVEIDWDKIKKDYGNKVKYTNDAQEQIKALFGEEALNAMNSGLIIPVDDVRLFTDYSLDTKDNDNNLKNNDKVSLNWNIDSSYEGALKVKIKAENKEYKVSGLKEVKTKDVFKDMDVEFSGISPNGQMTYNYNGDDLDSYNFTVDNTFGLSNGDKVTITINIDNMSDFADKYGYLPKSMKKEYTVSNLPEYVSKISDISDEAKEYMKNEADDVITAWTAGSKDEDAPYVVTGSEYVGDFLMSPKTSSSSAWYRNVYYMIYKVTYESNSNYGGFSVNDSSYAGQYYVAIGYSDLSVSENGEYEVDVSSHKGNSLYPGWTYKNDLGYKTLDDLKNDIVDTDATDYVCDGWSY